MREMIRKGDVRRVCGKCKDYVHGKEIKELEDQVNKGMCCITEMVVDYNKKADDCAGYDYIGN